MVGCGDIPTQEALAATALLREHFPDLKLRFINVVDLFKLQNAGEHPHGLSDRDFDGLFTKNKPIIFAFHGYPWLIHRLTYRRTNHDNLHVRGYKEKGNINTPLELAINNQIDRFSLAIDVIDRIEGLQASAAHVKQKLLDLQIECRGRATARRGLTRPVATRAARTAGRGLRGSGDAGSARLARRCTRARAGAS
jgi:xylulose-5-phosphate/fructose-6-phosphate phosphoketolase